MKYESTKHYGHEQGLSCAFRQWRAQSHCNKIHGYSLAFTFVFGAESLDSKGWVVDFGALKPLKEKLIWAFDHTLAVAGDDPQLEEFEHLKRVGMANVIVFPNGVGCEKFAMTAFGFAISIVHDMNRKEGGTRIQVLSAECREHAGNSAIYRG